MNEQKEEVNREFRILKMGRIGRKGSEVAYAEIELFGCIYIREIKVYRKEDGSFACGLPRLQFWSSKFEKMRSRAIVDLEDKLKQKIYLAILDRWRGEYLKFNHEGEADVVR